MHLRLWANKRVNMVIHDDVRVEMMSASSAVKERFLDQGSFFEREIGLILEHSEGHEVTGASDAPVRKVTAVEVDVGHQ